MSYATELAFAKNLAEEAGKIMRRYFRAEDIGTKSKEDHTPVTVADIKINSLVISRVKTAFPDDGVLGEEESFEDQRDRIWVVDPIDGTIPFSLSIPVSTFMLALVNKKDGQPVVAVVYDPYLGHLYSAVKGEGAFLNDIKLQASPSAGLIKGYGTLYGSVIKDETINYVPGEVIEKLRTQHTRIININSGGYTAVKVAAGEFIFVAMGNGLAWDSAAPALIVEEAGGVVTDLAGRRRRFDQTGRDCLLAANQAVADEFLKLVKASSHENSGH